MKNPVRRGSAPETCAWNDADMAVHGITRITVESFCYRDFRYAALRDAAAQAKSRQPELKHDPVPSSENPEEMARYGIVRVPLEFFAYGKFRYARLVDALAEAKRQPGAG